MDEDNVLLESLVLAILVRTGMENTEYSVVRSACKLLDLIRKEELDMAGRKFAAGTKG